MYVSWEQFSSQTKAIIKDMDNITRAVKVIESVILNLQKEEYLVQEYQLSKHAKAWSFLNSEEAINLMQCCQDNNITIDYAKGCTEIMKQLKDTDLSEDEIEQEWIKFIKSNMEDNFD